METVVVTSFTPEGYERYGRNFLESWNLHWPNRLILYTHNQRIKGHEWVNAEEVPTIRAFLDRHKDNPVAKGLVPNAGWKESEVAKGYSFRFNAYVFGRKPLIIADAMRRLPPETKLFWLDADIITFRGVPSGLLGSLLSHDLDLCFLPSNNDLTESSCVGFNLSRQSCRDFIEEFESIYVKDRFYDEVCWDDGHVFDYLVARLKPSFSYIRGMQHPFEQSILGKHMFHLRGPSKDDAGKVKALMDMSRRTAAKEKAIRKQRKRRVGRG